MQRVVSAPAKGLVKEVNDSLMLLFMAAFSLFGYVGIALLLVEAVR